MENVRREQSTLNLFKIISLGALLGVICAPYSAWAFEVSGNISSESHAPVAGATVTLWPNVPGPTTITVFSDSQGNYRFPEVEKAPLSTLKLVVRKIGFAISSVDKEPGKARNLLLDVVLQSKDNVAEDVSPADWLDHSIGLPHTQSLERAVLQCGDCHALPSAEIKRMAASLNGQNENDRRVAWAGIVDRMRQIFGGYLDEEQRQEFFTNEDQAAISAFLAKKLPTDYTSFSLNDWQKCCERSRAGSEGAIVREYNLPVDNTSWTREVVIPVGSKYVWGTDLTKERIFRLDPTTGELKWISSVKNGGLHTLMPDNDGNFWGSALLLGSLVKFDPSTEHFRVYPKFESPDSRPVLVGDEAQDSRRRIGIDHHGRVWVNLPSHNMLGSLDPVSGEVHEYGPLPVPEGRTDRNAVLYGSVMTSDGKYIWWSQILGDVGVFNIETLKNEAVIKFPLGSGPRRMAIDDQDRLWLPLYGAGQLVEYDTRQRREIARYDLPTRNAAIYSVTWDKKRNAVWCGTMETNSIFRFDINERRWTEYKMPRDSARFRVVPIDDRGDIWGTYGTFPGNLERSTMVMRLSPGP